ncbi:MAG: Rieske 2Fe-2S domain-containing protein [Pseudomonadales bacterium]|nr:Rieske 2Fe-2S domain-containing protein [Pseudomonadales bacterium]
MTDIDISSLLTEAEIAHIKEPIEQAGTLPARCFTDDEFYQLEIDRIFGRRWVAVLFESDVAGIGDLRPFDLCGVPLLAVRTSSNDISIFHNICPYDGCLAVIDPISGASQIETPYHGWVYDLNGTLLEAPVWGGTKHSSPDSLNGKDINLQQVYSRSFLNTVFINLADAPLGFDDHIAPLHRALSEYDFSIARPGVNEQARVQVSSLNVKTNWKTHFENACINVLHENFVHEGYKVSPEIPRVSDEGVPTFQAIIDEKLLALSYKHQDFLQTYPEMDIPHLGFESSGQPETETFGTLYPNFFVSASSQFIEVGFALPDGPEETNQRMIYLYEKEVAESPDARELRTLVAEGFASAAQEDARICEAVQLARRSPVFNQKFYSPFWDQMHYEFSNWVLADLEQA